MLRRVFSKAFASLSIGLALLAASFAFSSVVETSASGAVYSDRVGVYALIDRVILEPNESAPERIQIWGAFALAHVEDRNNYESPQRGYFYYSLKAGKEDICRREWADFKALAGTGEVIGFGGRFEPKGRLRKADEKVENPDAYPVAWGLARMSQQYPDYAPIRDLRSLPAPRWPAEGAEVKAGAVTLVARNVAAAGRSVKYVFEIKAVSSGEQEVSPPVAPGEKETKWSPNLKVKVGEKYTWRVKVTDGQWVGPVAASEFKGMR
jgi:hypothetical protein